MGERGVAPDGQSDGGTLLVSAGQASDHSHVSFCKHASNSDTMQRYRLTEISTVPLHALEPLGNIPPMDYNPHLSA